MRVVIIGAGAVGVVLGDSLERQKHDVTYLVRPGRKKLFNNLFLADAATGEVRRRENPNSAELGAKLPPFEWALICVRGDQFADGLAILAEHIRPDAKVGVASARLDDLAQARAAWTQGPVFSISPAFAAWTEEKNAWRWFRPPLLKTLVSGEGDATAQAVAEEFAAALAAAGVPAAAVPSARKATLPMLSSGMALLAGWELSGWDAGKLARSDEMRGLTAAAMREAAQAVRGEGDSPVTRLLSVMPPMALGLLIRALPMAARGRVLEMWSHHGPKIAGQTRSVLDELLGRAAARGVPTPRLRELRDRLGATPAAPVAAATR